MRPTRTALALDVIRGAIPPGIETLGALASTASVTNGRVPMDVLFDLWESLFASGLPHTFPVLATHPARQIPSASPNQLRILARATATIGEATAVTARFWPLVTDAYGLSVRTENGATTGAFGPVPSRSGARADLLFSMASIVGYAREWASEPVIDRVTLRDPASRFDGELEDVLQHPVTFDAAEDAIVFLPKAMDVRMVHHDPGLVRYLTPFLEEALARAEQRTTTVARVWRAFEESKDATLLHDVDAVARRLGTSERSLRRALAEEATSYSTLRDRYCEAVSRRLLPTASDDEIAGRLGFADAATFRRAFRRWTSTTTRAARST